LPSSGVLPFFRGLLCELNNSCYSLPQEQDVSFSKYNTDPLNELMQLVKNTFQFTNDPKTVYSAKTIATFFQDFFLLRNQANAISKNVTLSQNLYMSEHEFKNKLNTIVVDSALVEALLSSNPNYNYLYSNSSKNFVERNMLETFLATRLVNSQQIIDLLYGLDLDVKKLFLK
jgi:hypothetical protein